MTNYQSNWIFNIILKFAVIICLSVLALSLIIGIGPLTALLRSSVAFMTFAFLGWATSLVWDMSLVEEGTQIKEADQQSPKKDAPPSDKESPVPDNTDNREAVEEV